MNPWLKTIGLIAITALLTRFIPFSEYFRNVNTLIHEMAHALATLLLSGNVVYIHLFSDHSGVTYSSLPEAWRIIPVSLFGYIGASIFVVLLFRWYAQGKQQLGLTALTVLTAIGLIVFIRNPYGMVWCAGFIALCAVANVIRWTSLRDILYLLIAFICLVESVWTPIMLILIAVTSPEAAGDAANLEAATGIPALAWAIVFAVIALWCGKVAVGEMFSRGRRAKGRYSSSFAK